ncbi:MAG: hypothetical protein CL674_09930 [Bdellovibrionaceae bacterium]|nr:hypothetical protein [Pseudobdellovibrionaceae bacterium]|tara:strand:- start:40389 stop:41243 length:855 start_codon:yes stop_codon:yes gene_type:complete
MKALLLATLGVLVLSGCDNVFNGVLGLNKTLQIVEPLNRGDQRQLERCERNNSNSSRCRRLYKMRDRNTKRLEPGQYSAKLTASNSKMKLKINNDFSLEVKVPSDIDLPKHNGEINLPASETGFNYDINGSLETQISNSEQQNAVENCSWTEPRTRCQWVYENYPCADVDFAVNDSLDQAAELSKDPRKGKADRPGNNKRRDPGKIRDPRPRPRPPRTCRRRVQRCHTEYVTFYGYKDVSYYHKYTDRFIEFAMTKASNDEEIGAFAGENHETEKIYTYQSSCR